MPQQIVLRIEEARHELDRLGWSQRHQREQTLTHDVRMGDAAEALAGARHLEALEALLAFFRQPMATRRSVQLTLSASPLPESGEYLVSVIEAGPDEAAEAARTALGANHFRELHKDRLTHLGGGY